MPASAKLLQLPLVLWKQIASELLRLEDNDVIEQGSASEWVSPLMVVRTKKWGHLTLHQSVRTQQGRCHRCLLTAPCRRTPKLNGASYFCKLDLASAYHQLLLEESSRDLTKFITHEKFFHFKRVSFGLTSTSGVFQRMMSTTLKSCNSVA